MGLVPLDIPPGIYANGTDLQAAGRWRDGSLVRWKNGVMEPVGGWQATSATALAGFPRTMHAWRYGFRARRGAIGTNEKLYRYDGSDVGDITPVGLTTGRANTVPGDGFGAGAFGASTFGDARSVTGIVFDAATWSLDNFGDTLVAVRRDEGTIWEWDSATDVTAIAITGAPSALGLLVTDERHLVAFGASGDPRKIAWCDREDFTTWTAAATNSAGDQLLSTDGRYVGAVKTRYGVLVLTNVDAHVLRFVGQPYVYGLNREAANCGLYGPNAVIETPQGAAWMGPNGFFSYDGYVKEIRCDVFDRVFDDINAFQGMKIVAGGNSAFDEVWWFYPSAGSDENDRYVIWNHREGHWSFGELARGAWLDGGVFDLPLAVSPDGLLYQHETGWTDSGDPRLNAVFVESAPVTISAGERIAHVGQLINDEGGDGYEVTAYTRFTASGGETQWGPYQMRADGYTDARLSGRQVRLRFEGVTDARWRVGRIRADVVPGGKR